MSNSSFGTGEFEFGAWSTPFENSNIEVLEVAYGKPRSDWPEDETHYRYRSLFRVPGDNQLIARIYAYDSRAIFRVVFPYVSAFRVLDEAGLMQFWGKTSELGGRPGQTTFRVRNHLWTTERICSFWTGTDDGWSFVIASDSECLEVLALDEPDIVEETGFGAPDVGRDRPGPVGNRIEGLNLRAAMSRILRMWFAK